MSGGTAYRQSGLACAMRRTVMRAAGCVAALTVAAGAALADRVDDRDFAAAKVKELDSDLVRVRENAEDALRSWARNQTDRVLSLIEPGASAEQRDRLLSLARSVFETSARGAMGVSFLPVNAQFGNFDEEVFDGGIPIEAPVKGFDSERVIKPGDLLLSIDGVRVRTNIEARVQIVSHDAGQVVRLEIEREGKVLQLPLRLGNWGDLNATRGGRELATEHKDAAFRSRLARVNPALLTLDTKPVLRPVPGAMAWNEGERLANDEREKVVRIPESSNLRLGPGVQQRQVIQIGVDGVQQRLNLDGNGNATVAELKPTGVPREAVSEAPNDAELKPTRSVRRTGGLNPEAMGDIRLLELQKGGLEQQAAIVREQIKDRQIDADMRRALSTMLQRIENDIAIIDAQIVRRQRENRKP